MNADDDAQTQPEQVESDTSTEVAPPETGDVAVDEATRALYEADDLHARSDSAAALLSTLRERLEDGTQ